jgi:hypothetical protein
MPNRILKESICTSENIDSLSELAETFFYRLVVNCDDYGRSDARESVLLAKCFPLKLDRIKPETIAGLLVELQRAGLIKLYRYRNGRNYLELNTWDTHQSIRAKKSKHPGPQDVGSEVISSSDLQAIESRCKQLHANVPVIQSNPIQSNPNTNAEIKKSRNSSSGELALVGERTPAEVEQQTQVQASKGRKPKFSEETRRKMHSFIVAYSDGYKAKYGGPPEGIRDKAIIGKIGHWIESVSEERARNLVEVYLQVDYRPINESCHDLWQFFRHLNRIGNALSSGADPSGINWNRVFGGAA